MLCGLFNRAGTRRHRGTLGIAVGRRVDVAARSSHPAAVARGGTARPGCVGYEGGRGRCGYVGSDEEFIAPASLTARGLTVGGKKAEIVGCNRSLVLLETAGHGPVVQLATSSPSVGATVIAVLFGGVGNSDVVVLQTTASGTVPITTRGADPSLSTTAQLTPGAALVTVSPTGLELVGVVVASNGDWVPVTRETVLGLGDTPPAHC
jgi:hypothetical protein